jgi:Glycosyltransferase family 87
MCGDGGLGFDARRAGLSSSLKEWTRFSAMTSATGSPDRSVPAPSRRWPARGEVWIVALYALTAAFVTWQELHLDHINNWRMARWSFYQLLHGADLYAAYPAQYYDLYQYSPTFALLVAPFALLPMWLGLLLFNTFNIAVFYYAVRRLLPDRLGLVALLLLYFEVVRTTQNTEINTLVTGLIVLAFLWLESGRLVRAAAAIAAGAAIKIFPLAAGALGLPHRWRWRFALALAAALALAILAPLLVTPAATLLQQYRWWVALEHSYGVLRLESLMALLNVVIPGSWPNWPVQLAGTALLLLPYLVRRADWGDPGFRRAMLYALLLYLILFNHQAESPTFIIAMTGVVAWYLAGPRRWYHHALMALSWVLVSLFSVILPARVLNACCRPYHYKTIPILLVWLVMLWELLAPRRAGVAPPGAAAGAPAH